LKESAALPWVPESGAKEVRNSPWSALLNDAMLAQRLGPGKERSPVARLQVFDGLDFG